MSENSGNENDRPEPLTELDYFESARVIALYLDQWCDKNLIYPDMIADASRKVKAAFDELKAKLETQTYNLNVQTYNLNVMNREWTEMRDEKALAEARCDELKAENERLKQQSLGTQLVTAIAGIPYVPSNELELAMLKAENERLKETKQISMDEFNQPVEIISRQDLCDEIDRLAEQRDNYRKYADQLAQTLEESRKWYDEIYPDDVFIGGPNADDGVNRVVHLRMVTRKALAEYAKFREGKNGT